VLAELIDPRVVTAYQKKISPQRDFIYYGIDPNQGINSGPLNSGYAEFITSIQVNEYNSKSYIKDDFTDGMLEFHVTIFFLGRDGAGGSILKVFPCDPTKLFYDSSRVIGHPNGTSIYILPNPIPITDWNMQKYGSTWKVLVAEYDPGTEITQTSSMSSTFSSNFNFDVSLGETVKVGLKFGTSEVTVESGTITYKTTGSTDNLGEALLDYSAPVLLRIDSSWRTPMGQIYSINTGTVTLDIETRKRY
ncbi:MAG TPA: hypothetical protein VM802_22535, partial [Chitinophaga sp.]|uniref:hypothetical protein n=1 Tax=Chitinophaga sp. TaxID=1869181 RepID=UPI002BB27C70